MIIIKEEPGIHDPTKTAAYLTDLFNFWEKVACKAIQENTIEDQAEARRVLGQLAKNPNLPYAIAAKLSHHDLYITMLLNNPTLALWRLEDGGITLEGFSTRFRSLCGIEEETK